MSGCPWVWPPINVNVNNGGGSSDTVTNNSEVPGTNVTDALNALLAEGASVPHASGLGGDPSWDLEARKLTSPDLALAGWSVQTQNAPWTPLVRNGDVDATTVGAPVGTYNSTLVNGVLVMQGPVTPSAPIQIYRASDNLPHTYAFHVWCENYQNGNSDYCLLANEPNFDASGTTNFLFTGLEQAAPRHSIIGLKKGAVFTLLYNQIFENYQQNLVRYMRWLGDAPDPDTQVRFVSAASQQLVEANSPTVNANIGACNYVGVWMNAVLNNMFFIDFIRRLPVNQYP